MTYAALTSSTKISEAPDLLNGVTTRTEPGALNVGPATSATAGVASGVYALEFDLDDKASLVFALPARADLAVAPKLRLAIAPITGESDKECEFTFSSDTVTAGNTPIIGAGSESAVSGDVALGTTAGKLQIVDVTLSTAFWEAANAGAIVGILQRTAIADGSELTGDVAVVSACLLYSIER